MHQGLHDITNTTKIKQEVVTGNLVLLGFKKLKFSKRLNEQGKAFK
jgi:hypothetical protein